MSSNTSGSKEAWEFNDGQNGSTSSGTTFPMVMPSGDRRG